MESPIFLYENLSTSQSALPEMKPVKNAAGFRLWIRCQRLRYGNR